MKTVMQELVYIKFAYRSKRKSEPAEKYAKFDFVFQKAPKPCTCRGLGTHGNTKENLEKIIAGME